MKEGLAAIRLEGKRMTIPDAAQNMGAYDFILQLLASDNTKHSVMESGSDVIVDFRYRACARQTRNRYEAQLPRRTA